MDLESWEFLLRKETEQKLAEVDLFDECLWHDKRVGIGLEYPVASIGML